VTASVLARAAALLGPALLAGCSRSAAPAATDAGADVAPAAYSSAPPAGDPGAAAASSPKRVGFVAVPGAEARRYRASAFSGDAALKVAEKALSGHFAGARGPFDVQSAPLTVRGMAALLVSEADRAPAESRPFVLVTADGAVAWSKERPVAGIMPPVGPVAIAPAPAGRVALAAWDPPTSAVALRLWDRDGSPFADFQAMQVDACDALSLLFWRGHGFVLVAARVGATRAQLVTETGSLAWGQGLDLGARSRTGAIAPASLAVDTDESFVLVQLVQPLASEGSPFHALAFRYDSRGGPIWPAAVDLGPLPRPPAAGERARVEPLEPGVRVTLPSGAEIEVRPSGDVKRR
jgi:hypothetical protein